MVERFRWIAARVEALTGYKQSDNKSQNVKVVWPPALKFVDTSQVLAELQQLRGEADAIQTTSIAKRCENFLWQETSPTFALSDLSSQTAAPSDATKPAADQ